MTVLWFINRVLLSRIKKKVQGQENGVIALAVSLAEKAVMPILYFIAFYLAFKSLDLGPRFARFLDLAALGFITFFAIRFTAGLASKGIENFWLTREKDAAKAKTIMGLTIILKAAIWVVGIIFLFDNLGYKVSTIVAGLGIGGIAVALAAQAILGDLFSYMSILFDRPFETGDFIIVGDSMGTVENIGIKTTRIRSLGGEELIFSNSDLTNSRVRNYKRMFNRRVVFSIGIVYGTPKEKLEKILL
ncbi:MAG TPA: mechanosensitive ion channel family protein, partial [bacterium]|nr:mechanosensitive ion channel family protein [bacterium]